MKNFYNERSKIVSHAIDGLVASAGGKLRRFEPSSYAQVVVRADWDKSKVAIISGGGSGHEPAHAGLVGPGMLTAAVCGGVYASPSVDAILSAILGTTGPSGCLLIIKNYTGDRLNFGLAAEKAKAKGYKVEMVIVADDVAIPDAVQPRGIAGTILVHKVAGYTSEQGHSLDAVLKAARSVNTSVRSLGLARDTCTVPGSERPDRIGDDETEVGLGIHGEPGVDVQKFTNCRELMRDFSTRLMPHLDPSKRHVALFNDLGGLNGLESAILFKEFMETDLAGLIDFTIGPVPIMTALDMPGFSISMLPLDDAYEAAIMADAQCDAWPQINRVRKPEPITPPELDDAPSFEASSDPKTKAIVESIIDTCLSMEKDLNLLDAKVGDGDTGTTFAAAAQIVKKQLSDLPFAKGEELLAVISDVCGKSMGGSSGILFAIMFANASDCYKQTQSYAAALSHGLEAMQKYGGAGPGDRTMIDALKPALDAIAVNRSVSDAAQNAREGADSTAKMLSAKAGRSSYLEARSLDGFSDPGAEGIARVFENIRDL